MDDSTSNPDEYMEDQNSNELNQSIAAWRRQLLASEAIQPEDADELETHLRASVTQLMEQGLSPDEALLVAQHRLGTVEQVQGEFEKINEHRYWGHRFLWMIVGYLGISLVMTSIKLAASISVLFGKFYALNGIQMGWMHNIATLALFTAFMTGLYGVSTGTIQLPYLLDKMHQYNNRVKIIAFVKSM